MSTKANQNREQSPNEALNHAVDFNGRLPAGELLTGTPTVTISPADVTLSNKQVNTGAVTILGNSVIAGKAVLFTVPAGLTLNSDYIVTISCGTNSSPAETIVGTLSLSCRT